LKQKFRRESQPRKNKNWALADQIRDDLKNEGIILEDAPDGTTPVASRIIEAFRLPFKIQFIELVLPIKQTYNST
jgi:hypothetical protein